MSEICTEHVLSLLLLIVMLEIQAQTVKEEMAQRLKRWWPS